jgi:integrase
LLRAGRQSNLEAIIAVALVTGLRRDELLALRWSDVDLAARRLTVRRSLETVEGDAERAGYDRSLCYDPPGYGNDFLQESRARYRPPSE